MGVNPSKSWDPYFFLAILRDLPSLGRSEDDSPVFSKIPLNSHNFGKSSFSMGKSSISMAMVTNYVKVPEGILSRQGSILRLLFWFRCPFCVASFPKPSNMEGWCNEEMRFEFAWCLDNTKEIWTSIWDSITEMNKVLHQHNSTNFNKSIFAAPIHSNSSLFPSRFCMAESCRSSPLPIMVLHPPVTFAYGPWPIYRWFNYWRSGYMIIFH